MVKTKRKNTPNPKNNKKNANNHERETAKDLSIWIFGNSNTLKRHPSSGAEKSVYAGDIYPMGQMPPPWISFPFHIECKRGYEDKNNPIGFSKQIITWYTDCRKKMKHMKTEKWAIIIWKIPYRGTMFCTDLTLGNWMAVDNGLKYPEEHILIPYREKRRTTTHINIYDYNTVLKHDFNNLFDINMIVPKAKSLNYKLSLDI